MYYSNKCQLFCIREQSAGGKRGGMVCKWLTYKQWWARDEIEIYMRIMDSVHALLIRTEENSKLAQKWIITDEATIAPCVVHTYVRDSII